MSVTDEPPAAAPAPPIQAFSPVSAGPPEPILTPIESPKGGATGGEPAVALSQEAAKSGIEGARLAKSPPLKQGSDGWNLLGDFSITDASKPAPELAQNGNAAASDNQIVASTPAQAAPIESAPMAPIETPVVNDAVVSAPVQERGNRQSDIDLV